MYFYLFLFLFFVSTIIFIRTIYRRYLFKYQKYIDSKTTIMITGGCHGIGREIIKILLKNYKCTVINIDICKEKFKDLEEYFNINSNNIGRLINCDCDISDVNQINSCIDNILSQKKIDILINNAAIAYNKYFEELEDQNFVNTIHTNLIAPMLISKKLLNQTEKQFHLVNIASVMSHITSCRSTDYTSSKWGLFAFHECLRYDYYHYKNVKFTVICPYAVNTGMFEGFVSPIPMVKILSSNYVALKIVESIVLNDKIVYIPFYMEYIALSFKILPTCLRDYLYFKFSKIIFVLF